LVAITLAGRQARAASGNGEGAPAVTLHEDNDSFVLANGLVKAKISKATGRLASMEYKGLELLAVDRPGSQGGYWSSVGRARLPERNVASVRVHPSINGGARAEVSCAFLNDSASPAAPIDADYRYALWRGETCVYAYAVLEHKPGYPAFGVGEARYALKLNPGVFNYLTIDADRRRVMPTGEDWDRGAPLNLKEARRMTTGLRKGEAEHKYDYSAVLAETPAYGWSSTKYRVGLWLINPSIEYLGGGPTKAELTGHLDVNPGGLPTLLNMWVGSHYGGTTLAVAQEEAWTKVVGPFVLYCNAGSSQEALWRDALDRAAGESAQWPYNWVADPRYVPASARTTVAGQLALRDPFAPEAGITNCWVGLTAPDYAPPRTGYGPRRFGSSTNSPGGGYSPANVFPSGGGLDRGGFPLLVDWQRDARFYQYWARADSRGRFQIKHVAPGTYTLRAIADGVLGEFSLTNVTVKSGADRSLGELAWTPHRFGRTVWQIGIPDRTAREFRNGDRYWHWGLYFNYPKEFPRDVNFVVGQSDWHRDWNYVQPPRVETQDVPVTSEEDEEDEGAALPRSFGGGRNVRSTAWSITFSMPEAARGRATLRLAFCGTHAGCHVEALVNGKSIGDTGPLPSTSAMQRDGIRAFWIEKPLGFDAALLNRATNVIQLVSHANSWNQGVMYDCVRLELAP
jgi:rhamnogalacturonan endolyase